MTPLKTLQQAYWFSQWLTNLDITRIKEYFKYDYQIYLIDSAFSWNTTPEGFNFWEDIHYSRADSWKMESKEFKDFLTKNYPEMLI